jgi:beta-glucosidase
MNNTPPKSPLQFPKRFLWGASTAAHQVEGSNHNQWSVWELENAKAKAAQAEYHLDEYDSWDDIKHDAKQPDNYVSGALGDHYQRYEEDFDMIQKMHMNAYRFSVEWSRIEPSEGVWNAEALAHYKYYILSLKKRGIEPVMTLFHFTLPVWFTDKGGFEHRSNVTYFTRFVEKVVSEVGTHVRLIITINEPEVYVFESYYLQNWPPNKSNPLLALHVMNNLALAHKRSSKIIHGINRRFKVSIAKNSNYFYAGDDAWISRTSAAVGQYFQDDFIIKKFIKQCDFLGVNYYQSQRFYGYRIHNPSEKHSDVQWELAPADIQFALERLHEKYHIPMIITENGLADWDDSRRQWWITQTLIGMQKAMSHGVQLQGYLHWSLMDNFEWAYGKWPRFGLMQLDYKTGERSLRPSAKWFGRVIKKIRGV